MHESGLDHVLGNEHRSNIGKGAAAMTPLVRLPKSNVQAGPFRKFLDRFFYLGMGLLVAAVVIFGFGQTIGANLLHPDRPRPWILPIHAIVFASWVVLFITQSALVRASRTAVHRRLGIFGAALGGILPFFGVATALVMQHYRDHGANPNDAGLSPSLQRHADVFDRFPAWPSIGAVGRSFIGA